MKRLGLLCFLLACLWLTMGIPAVAVEKDTEELQLCIKTQEVPTESRQMSADEAKAVIDALLQNEEAIQYYAYLDLDTAAPELAPVILKARNIIIFRESWVADGIQGYVHDSDGNLVEVVPQFSELFPEEWSVPVLRTGVDLSYYGK